MMLLDTLIMMRIHSHDEDVFLFIRLLDVINVTLHKYIRKKISPNISIKTRYLKILESEVTSLGSSSLTKNCYYKVHFMWLFIFLWSFQPHQLSCHGDSLVVIP